jgi:hypothetical protein
MNVEVRLIAYKKIMRKISFVILLLLLLQTPYSSKATVFGQNLEEKNRSHIPAVEKVNRSADSEDDIFSSTYERELLSHRIFKKFLPPLSRKEAIRWSFKTAKANTFL